MNRQILSAETRRLAKGMIAASKALQEFRSRGPQSPRGGIALDQLVTILTEGALLAGQLRDNDDPAFWTEPNFRKNTPAPSAGATPSAFECLNRPNPAAGYSFDDRRREGLPT
ncbi:MAG: hypothetical protein J0M24_10835 [Verrucomicrobia bacterium]|nr:hypothetical protein [Verrucomicrobiota bacterium]